jgi:hypothetical protein
VGVIASARISVSTTMGAMQARERRKRLRGLIAQGDGASLVELLRLEALPGDALQLVGDGLAAALTQSVEGAAELAQQCVAALRERGWDGDAEPAEQLSSRLGAGPTPLLRGLTVDLEEISMVLEGDPLCGGGRIDRRSGEVWPRSAIDYAVEIGEEDEDDETRWLWVDCEGSRAGYRDMERFAAGVNDPEAAAQLGRALDGRGAFARFKRRLTQWPELEEQWYAYSDERQRGRARAWLVDQGYTVTPPPMT